MYIWNCFVLTLVINCWDSFAETDSKNDYCSGEKFNPSCNADQVIVMKHALYGRMEAGRCIDVKVESCSEDILSPMDRKCSGKYSCEIVVPDFNLNELVPCTKMYTPYLEATYECINVVSVKGGCPTSYTIPVTSIPKTIASITSKKTQCGLPASPWSLQAKPGQMINITIMDFNWKNQNRQDDLCATKYGYIVDVHSGTSGNEVYDICGGGQSRQRGVHISHGHLVQIIFQEDALQQYSFLIQVQAIGCPDFNPPRNAWMRKEDNKVTIGCHGSDDQWVLKCQGIRWIGKYENCPEDIPSAVIAKKNKSGLPNVVSLTLIGGGTLVICCVAVTSIIVLFCYRKYKINHPDPEYYTTAVTSGNTTLPFPSGTIVSFKSYRPVSTVDNRQTLGTRRSVNTNNPFQTDTLTGQIINTSHPDESNMIDEVIYDDPANLDINNVNNVEYVNQFNTINSTGTGMVNSLQYTKLQKNRT